jgi:hypothetical protein
LETIERPALNALPTTPYSYAEWKRARELSLVMLKFTKRSLQVEMLGGLCGLGNPIT